MRKQVRIALAVLSVALLGMAGIARQSSPPPLAVTNAAPLCVTLTCPTNVTQPILQLTADASKPLSDIRLDVFNSAGSKLDLQGHVISQDFDKTQSRFTVNHFQFFDVPLALSTNLLVVRVADIAGSWVTNSYIFTYDLSKATNAPVFTLLWPKDGDQLSGKELSLRGKVDNPSVTVAAQIVDGRGQTNLLGGLVERNGLVWVERMPLTLGRNSIKLDIVDAAGNRAATNLTVTINAKLTIDPIPEGTLKGTKVDVVSGTINMEDCTVWVNGVRAVVEGTNWHAYSVPLGTGGTAVIQARAIPNSRISPSTETNSPATKK
jgi:hypothetical protein